MGSAGHADATVTSDGIVVRYRTPAPDLTPYVIDYGFYDSGPSGVLVRTNDYLPGPANVCITFDAGPLRAQIRNRTFSWGNTAMVFGPSSQLMRVHSDGGRMIGFGITPLGWARLFGKHARRVANQIVPLASLWGEVRVTTLYAALERAVDADAAAAVLDDALRFALLPATRDAPVIAALSAAVHDPATHDCLSMADELGIPMPQLRRVAQHYFGFGPKLLLRRTRFVRAALTLMRTEFVADDEPLPFSPYYDQSHFIRDAQQFLGKTARQFSATLTPLMVGMLEGRHARFGTPLQALIASPDTDAPSPAHRPQHRLDAAPSAP